MIAANWTPELVDLAGGQYGLAEPGRHSGYTVWDDIRAYDPECLIIAPCGFQLPRAVAEAQELVVLEGWQQLAAVREGRVFAVDGDAHFNRPGPRLVDTLELLAGLLEAMLSDKLALQSGTDCQAVCRLEFDGQRLVPTAGT